MERSEREASTRQLGLSLTDDQWTALERYVELVRRWNTRFNLISRRDVDRIWTRHVLDSLSLLPLLQARHSALRGGRLRALDVGTGAGLPGLPLAVADAGIDWLLVDRNTRKIRFLELVIDELGLGNVQARALDLAGTPPNELLGWADVIVSRAVAAPAALVQQTRLLLAPAGTYLLMTGAADRNTTTAAESAPSRAADEDLTAGFEVAGRQGLQIPGLDRVHEVTIIRRSAQRQQAEQRT